MCQLCAYRRPSEEEKKQPTLRSGIEQEDRTQYVIIDYRYRCNRDYRYRCIFSIPLSVPTEACALLFHSTCVSYTPT